MLTDRFYTQVRLDTRPDIPYSVNFPVQVGDLVHVEITRIRPDTTRHVDAISGQVISVTQARIFQ